MNVIYRILLAFSVTSWTIVIHSLNLHWQTGMLLLSLPILSSLASLLFVQNLGSDYMHECAKFSIADIELLPINFGYMIIGLLVNDFVIMSIIYCLVFVFTYFSPAKYYNIIYLICGYHYYRVKTNYGTQVLIIARGDIKRNIKEMSFDDLKRIDDNVYIAMSGHRQNIK